MTPELIISTLTLGFSGLGGFTIIMMRIGEMKIKVDTMWEHLLRKALADGINKGVLAMNSPVTVTPKATEVFKANPNLTATLQKYYAEKGHKLNEIELFMDIDTLFGDRIMKEISIDFGMHYGASLRAAMEIAKQGAKETAA